MSETTTTADPGASAAADTTAQAADASAAAAADTSASETNTDTATQAGEPAADTSSQSDSSEATDDGDDNSNWLKAKGIDPSDPEAVAKLAAMARESEKKMHASTAKASELQKALGSDQSTVSAVDALDIPQEMLDHPVLGQIVDRLRTLEGGYTNISTATRVNQFFSGNPDAKAYEPAMAKIVTDNSVIGELVKGGHMSVEQLYAMAKGSDTEAEQKVKQAGGKEALEQLADKQKAKAVRGNATSSAMAGSNKDDPFLAGFNNPYGK